jgi:enterobactin synthetase component D
VPSEVSALQAKLDALLLLLSTQEQKIIFGSCVDKATTSYCELSVNETIKSSSYSNQKRKNEYIYGRLALKSALLQSGSFSISEINNFSVTSNNSGAPILPSGFIGSISHKDGIALAIASTNTLFMGIGVDVEYYQAKRPPLHLKRMIEMIGNQSEFDLIEKVVSAYHGDKEYCSVFLLLFTIKEAAFKTFCGTCKLLSSLKLQSVSFKESATIKAILIFEQTSVTVFVAISKPLLLSIALRL